MAKKKLAMGRGLGAILSETAEAYEQNLSDNSSLVLELDVDIIKPNPYQPRKTFNLQALQELSESIKEHGLLQPVVVYDNGDGDYILIAGERRLRASKLAGLNNIKAIIAEIDFKRMRELAIIENIQREELNPIELALSYEELLQEYGITHEELSKRIGKSRTQITNTLRLLQLSEEVQQMLIEDKISQGHAKMLVTLDEGEQKLIVDSIIGQKLNVRD
ncbi:ParB/RepB/Spo0J family partition protein, partial [uncultured Helicobacter sp.]